MSICDEVCLLLIIQNTILLTTHIYSNLGHFCCSRPKNLRN